MAVRANAEDNPWWYLAINEGELDTLERKFKSRYIVDRHEEMNVLQSTWTFKCKRFPDSIILKFKAIFCVRGDHQIEYVEFFETFAPFVKWSTMLLMILLSLIL